MCHRIMALRVSELIEAMERRDLTGRATVTFSAKAPEAYPGSAVPVLLPASAVPSELPSDISKEKNTRLGSGTYPSIRLSEKVESLSRKASHERPNLPAQTDMRANPAAPGASEALVVKELVWGFDAPKDRKLVFNTRLDTALCQAQRGRGLWAEAILSGRCLVPVRGFYETSRSRYTTSHTTGKKICQQFLFQMPYHRVFLLAGVAAGSRFSIVTCEPNETVGAVHTRMPLVLSPGESAKWLWADFASLADRSGVELSCVAAP